MGSYGTFRISIFDILHMSVSLLRQSVRGKTPTLGIAKGSFSRAFMPRCIFCFYNATFFFAALASGFDLAKFRSLTGPPTPVAFLAVLATGCLCYLTSLPPVFTYVFFHMSIVSLRPAQ